MLISQDPEIILASNLDQRGIVIGVIDFYHFELVEWSLYSLLTGLTYVKIRSVRTG